MVGSTDVVSAGTAAPLDNNTLQVRTRQQAVSFAKQSSHISRFAVFFMQLHGVFSNRQLPKSKSPSAGVCTRMCGRWGVSIQRRLVDPALSGEHRSVRTHHRVSRRCSRRRSRVNFVLDSPFAAARTTAISSNSEASCSERALSLYIRMTHINVVLSCMS